MPDIEVTTSLTGDADDLNSELRAAQQGLTNFKAWAEALKIDIPVNIDLSKATTAFEAFKKMIEGGITAPVAAAVASAPMGFTSGALNLMQSFSSSTTNNTVNAEFNTLMANVDNSIQSSIQQVFAQYNAALKQSGGGAGGAGGGGGGGGIGIGSLGRAFTMYRSARELFGTIEGLREYDINSTLAGNDSRKQADAELKLFHTSPLMDLAVDPFGDKELGIKTQMQAAEDQQKGAEEKFALQQQVLRSEAQTGIQSSAGEERVRKEADEAYRRETAEIQQQRTSETGPLAQIHKKYQDLRVKQEVDLRNSEEYQSAIQADTFSEGPSLQQKLEAKMVNTLAGDQAKEERDAQAQLDKLAAQAAERRDNAVKIYRESQAARQESLSVLGVNVTNDEAGEAQMRREGRKQEADLDAFTRQRSQEATRLQLEAETERDPVKQQQLVDQARAAGGKMNQEIETFKARQGAEERQANEDTRIKAERVKTTAQEDVRAAGGDVEGVAMARLKREDQERIDLLEAQAKQLDSTNKADAARVRVLEDAEKQANDSREKALQTRQDIRITDERQSIHDATTGLQLRAQGKSYQATEFEADAKYDREITRLRRDPARQQEAEDMEKEKAAARAARQALRSEDIRHMDASVNEQHLQNQHRHAEADLAKLEEQHKQELFDAGGDPVKVAEVNQLHQERLEHFAQNNVTGTHWMSARDVYFSLQAGVFGDPSGKEGQSTAAANAKAKQELRNARPGVTPSMLHNIQQHGGHDGQGHAAPAAGAGKDKGTEPQAMVGELKQILGRFGEYVETLLSEAV